MQIEVYKIAAFCPYLIHRFLYRLEGLVADVMLDLAGVVRCGFLAYAERHQKFGEKSVSVVHLMRDLTSKLGQGKVSVGVNVYVAAFF